GGEDRRGKLATGWIATPLAGARDDAGRRASPAQFHRTLEHDEIRRDRNRPSPFPLPHPHLATLFVASDEKRGRGLRRLDEGEGRALPKLGEGRPRSNPIALCA